MAKKLNPNVPSTPSAIAQAMATPVVPATSQATTVIEKPNARAHLRSMFADIGTIKSAEEVFGKFHNVTIKTHLTDLKNPKYAGKQGVMQIVKLNDGTYKRVA